MAENMVKNSLVCETNTEENTGMCENISLQSDFNTENDNKSTGELSSLDSDHKPQNNCLLVDTPDTTLQSNSSELYLHSNFKPNIKSDNGNKKQLNTILNEQQPILMSSVSEKEENYESTSQVGQIQEIDGKYETETVHKNHLILNSSTKVEITYTSKTNEDEVILSENHAVKKKTRLIIYDSDSEQEPNETVTETEDQSATMQRLKELCDSESSVEEIDDNEEVSIGIVKQKGQPKNVESKETKMTGKEAKEQRQEIVSNYQKMVRESKISLPYHVPKQHTLKEFLKRRSLVKTSTEVPLNTSTGLSIKMCSKNIKIIQTKLKQKEKEIEEFYKSESENEDQQEIEQFKQAEQITCQNKNIENRSPDEDSIIESDIENKWEIHDNEKQIPFGNCLKEMTQEKKLLGINSEKIHAEENKQECTNFNENQKELLYGETNEDESKVEESQIEKNSKNVGEKLDLFRHLPHANVRDSDKNIQDISEIQLTDERNVTNENIINAEDTDEQLTELSCILENKLAPAKHITEVETVKNNTKSEFTKSVCTEINSQIEISQEVIKVVPEKEEKEIKLAEVKEKLNKLNPLVAIKGNLHPRLSSGPNEFVVLDANIEKSKQVTNFMQRFLNHAVKKSQEDHGTIDTNVVAYENVEDECTKSIQIPGVRMKKLRMNLAYQINKQRLEDLKRKQEEEKLDNEDESYVGERETCALSNKVLDNEEEEELTDSFSSSEEEEEAYVEIIENPRNKSALVYDEAEVSDATEESEEIEEKEIENTEDDYESEDSEIDENIKTNINITSKKTLKRIVKLSEDSDEDEDIRIGLVEENEKKNNEHLEETQLNKNAYWEAIDNDIPAYQQPSEELEKTPCKIASQKQDFTNILTPTVHLTALQGMDSTTKSFHGSPNINSFLPPDPSPLKLNTLVKTKLFIEQEESNLKESENLCFGKFSAQNENKTEKRMNDLSTQENELLDICSGRFTGFTQNESSTEKSTIHIPKPTESLDLLMSEDSNNFKLTIENDTTDYLELNSNTEKQKLLLEENSNQSSVSNRESFISEENLLNSKYPVMKICSTSEEEYEENVVPKIKKLKKKKRKYIIDDISITDEDELKENIDEIQNIDYDSEENEIENYDEQILQYDYKSPNKASEFFEVEAELSESDWGSEDEDEKNLDDYEIEEGDAEKINEKKVQRELERMHMRNILDDDQKEVKLLQELLLEDGELHGTGRERKFRWKNADSLWNDDSDKPNDKEEEHEEMECELQWRKMRHEREMFLEEQQNKRTAGEEDILNDSQLMKLGHIALTKSSVGSEFQNLSQKKTPIAESVAKKEDIKLPFVLTSKRGSFLQRSETTLQRLAEITKIGGNIGGPKNSKNFIFTSVTKTELPEENVKKRKAEASTPKVLKKLRIANMSPSVQKNKKKLPL